MHGSRRLFLACGWLLTGALLGVGLVTVWTYGALLLLIGFALALLLILRWDGLVLEASWVLSGLAAGPLWHAWANRGGPGTACTFSDAVSACVTLDNPGPPALGGALLVLAGAALATLGRRRDDPGLESEHSTDAAHATV